MLDNLNVHPHAQVINAIILAGYHVMFCVHYLSPLDGAIELVFNTYKGELKKSEISRFTMMLTLFARHKTSLDPLEHSAYPFTRLATARLCIMYSIGFFIALLFPS